MIRIVVVDDHPVVREGLARYLGRDPELLVEASVGSGAKLLARIGHPPDVVLMDMHLPDRPGPELVREMLAAQPSVRVLALSSFADEDLVAAAFDAGVLGYLLKDADPEALRRAIKRVARGETVVPPDIEAVLERRRRMPPPEAVLSPREREVLGLMGEGLSNREIGERLYISEKTVKTHVSHVLAKLDVADRTGAILEGIRRHFIRVE